MSMETSLEAEWGAYLRLVYPQGVPDNVRKHLYDAYMGGASVLFDALVGAMAPGDDVTDAEVDRVAALKLEIDAWKNTKIALAGLGG